MAHPVGWYPDPTGRYSHRRWDGEGWTSRVFAGAGAIEDAIPVVVPSGHKVYCRVCHAVDRAGDWRRRCRRCSLPLTAAYIATKPQLELKGPTLTRAAQVSFEDVLEQVDRALAAGDDSTALRRLDTAIAYGTVLRAIAASSKSTRVVEPLTLGALIELHLQALRLHSKFAACFDPETFELLLLRRLAAMYAPEGRDDLPGTISELVAFCASRAEYAEADCHQVNDSAAHYSSAYEWLSLRVALARLGYEFDEKRQIGNGPFAPGERGRIEAAAVLGVDAHDRGAAIKKAYYREAAKHHPDRLGEAPDDLRLAAEERMKEINAAYELLNA
ncbi:MAG TPA: DnaJ domain-containing protein [Acidimicrobiales bacterium]|nr:DnaJ domain-containing protein [Acidimicrobiales bacterium]